MFHQFVAEAKNTSSRKSDETLDKYYDEAKNTGSDINQHINTLFQYALKCDTIVHCGGGKSDWAFLKGLYCDLLSNPKKKKTLIICEAARTADHDEMEKLCTKLGIKFQFLDEDDLKAKLPKADMFFINSWHVYPKLVRELTKAEKLAQKFIVMHCTETDFEVGESVRMKHDISKKKEETGFTEEDMSKGLAYAIDEFLTRNTYGIREVHFHNNGLTVLERL